MNSNYNKTILHVNAADISGGAARAAYRIHQSIADEGSPYGFKSYMRSILKNSDYVLVKGGIPQVQNKFRRRMKLQMLSLCRQFFSTKNSNCHSIAWPKTGLGKELASLYDKKTVDLIHLHWLGNNTLSVEEIGSLKMPLVWTLHDQWAFCGCEHYTNPPQVGEAYSSDDRFEHGYTSKNRPDMESGPDLNKINFHRKQKSWKRPIHIVAPSKWLGDCVRKSNLMSDWPLSIIPYPIDLVKWTPVNKRLARQLLGLPPDIPIILFGALGGVEDHRKGADLLVEAIQHIHVDTNFKYHDNLKIVVFGQSAPQTKPNLPFEILYMGRLYDDISLRLLYSASDVFVLPSRQDNLPNTGLEAHACGTPVVAFNTCGLADIVDDRVTGALATPFDSISLAKCIKWVLDDPGRHANLSKAARKRAEHIWDPATISKQYSVVYNEVLEKFRRES